MIEAACADAEDALGVETEEVHSVAAVVSSVRPEVEFGEPESPAFGDPRRPDIHVREGDDGEPRVAVVRIDRECRREVQVEEVGVDGPVREQNVSLAPVECCHHRLATSVRILGSWSAECMVTFLPGW